MGVGTSEFRQPYGLIVLVMQMAQIVHQVIGVTGVGMSSHVVKPTTTRTVAEKLV